MCVWLYRARRLKFPMACMTSAGAHNSAPYAYFWSKIPAVERSRSDRPFPIFSGSPALIPDLILPVEVRIGGGPTAPQQHLIFQAITTGIDSSQVSEKLCNLWRRKILSGSLCVATQSFVATHADTCRCTSVVLFLESDVAVVGLITVRTAQIWGRKIASEIIALNARSQDFGGPLRWNHPLILNS